MKIMIVSSDLESVHTLESVLKNSRYPSYSIIHYSQALKAIDNFEEIMPDVIFWDANGYPRHWKMIPSLYKNTVHTPYTIVLFSTEKLSDNELQKAQNLGIHTLIQSECTVENVIALLSANEKQEVYKPIPSKRPMSEISEEKLEYMLREDDTVHLIFSDPQDFLD